jgi:hypothetical protein
MAHRSSGWWFLLICLVAAVGIRGGMSVADGETIMPKGITTMHFERSGGVVALGRRLAGDVVLGPDSFVRDSEGSGAPRPLTVAEKAMFAKLDPVRLREFEQARRARPIAPGLPDDYQYDLALTFADGSTIKLTFYGQSVGELRTVPGLTELAAWVQTEIDSIWARR